MKLVRTEILEHFQYATLSHCWALGKLQNFCAVALKRDYLWAWSGTCCIDKHVGNEVQKRYHQCLRGIDSPPDYRIPFRRRRYGFFREQRMVYRGWTLQELLAPRTILFYTRDWSLYKNIASSNHKTDAVVLDELETATGIESRFLTNFSPALGRLLVEIISVSGDVSVLDWIGEPSQFRSYFPSNITWYRSLPSPLPCLDAEERPLATSVLRNLLTHSLFTCDVPTILRRTPVSSAPSGVIELYPFINAPLPRLPCIAYYVTMVELQRADPSTPSYTYNVRASGLVPLRITLPSQGALHLVRPWHSKLLGPSAKPDNYGEHKRIATSTLTAQPATGIFCIV
ncbi:hypothetical protein EDD16DRAFT_1578831 [Pisolithus croceorrhizus]|nr:hypothetical protein EDD16DRAFT_1578831 [Pisolithus croceorrhizus]